MKYIAKYAFLVLLMIIVTVAAASADEKERIKEVLSLSGSISAFSNIGNFTEKFGEPDGKESISEIKADKYQWNESTGIPNVSYHVVALADKSQNVTGWGISIIALDPDGADGSPDYDKTERLFLLACRGMEEQTKQASKVRVSGGSWGTESEAFYRGGNGKIIRVRMTRYDDGDASILIDEKSEEYARTRSLRLKGSNVNVREQPSTKAKILGRISSSVIGDSFSSDSEKQNQGEKFPWYKIRVDHPYTKFNGEGWVYGEFLRPVEYSLDEYEKSGCPWWDSSMIPMRGGGPKGYPRG
jgi:hypothetical protein